MKRRAWRAPLLLTLALRFPPLQLLTLQDSAHFTQPVMTCPCPIVHCPLWVSTLQHSATQLMLTLIKPFSLSPPTIAGVDAAGLCAPLTAGDDLPLPHFPQVSTLQDSAQRTALVLDRIAYEQDPDALFEVARPQQEALQKKIVDARARLKKGIKISDELQVGEVAQWGTGGRGRWHVGGAAEDD